MAKRSISMRMAREIIRLYFGLHLKKRQISLACRVAPSTVVEYVRKAEDAGLAWPLPEDLDDVALEALLNEQSGSSKPTPRPLPDMEEIHRELRKKGVTLQFLWLEYKERCPEGGVKRASRQDGKLASFLYPDNIHQLSDLLEFRIARYDRCLVFNCRGKQKTVGIGDTVLCLVLSGLIYEAVRHGQNIKI
jgi:hypothetical protein